MPNFIALTSAGIELLLAEELVELGATDVAPKVQSVHFSCSFETAQKICLWTRLATRILRHVVQVSGSSKEKIYDGVLGFDWHPFFTKTKVFAVEFVGTDKSIRNSQFGGQIVKDAIVDNIREETGKRPDVDKQSPDLIIQARLFKGQCNVYVDFSGPSLHQRGYRKAQGAAPLKEHLAAGIIRRSGWDGKSSFVDLFCGSGTLLIEAAMINKNRASGLTRRQFSFVKHPEFLVHKYEAIRDEAIAQEKPISADIIGFEIVGYVLDIARENIAMAGLEGDIKLAQQDAVKATVGKDVTPGWIVSNPPYGERIGDSITLLTLFKKLGFNLKSNYVNWNMSLLCTENTLLKLLKLQKDKEYKFKNGAIDILLVKYQLTEQQCEMGNVTSNGYF
ncbi:THUMP domain-containing class I SAM-dependent RNA methyltransferase [Psychrosphaera algicola]|uniref:THUMP domain-containing protein n=1 Tax=Psychrosphaera algicola TaxID=3023714 RepID=A0ABT5FAK2_9GAMM|nr:THUMP domain-containing protein [Psychrosphaera sp. G1-22]MDC2887972.1 THUMP domain-containing protein [Psychrosphaera sp. G1-22]